MKTLTIYQLGDDDEAVKMRFMNYGYLESHNFQVESGKYDAVYTGPVKPGETLEDIYTRFNLSHPDGYKGHSLSVSDVVALHDEDGTDTAYFVDSCGVREVPDFFCREALYRKASMEQEAFRAWLVEQSPEEILNHTYEYTMREDILIALEGTELSAEQVKALLGSPCPLADLYRTWEKQETGYMDDIQDTIESYADRLIQQKEEAARHNRR